MSKISQFKIDRIPFYVSPSAEYFRCWHPKTNKQHCLKRFSLNCNSYLRVEDEFSMQTRCGRFANVLETYHREYYQIEDSMFSEEYVLVLQEGFQENLRIWLRRNWARAVEVAEQMVQQLLPTLARMEEQEIYHRNLGLEAVFVASEEPLRLKLGEFCCSKLNMSMSTTTNLQNDVRSIKRGAKNIDFIESQYINYDPELISNPKVINIGKSEVYMFGVMVLDCAVSGRLSHYQKISLQKFLQQMDPMMKEQLNQSKILKKVFQFALKPNKTERPNFVELLNSVLGSSQNSSKPVTIVTCEQNTRQIIPQKQEIVSSPQRVTITQQTTKRVIQPNSPQISNTSSASQPESLGITYAYSQIPTQRTSQIRQQPPSFEHNLQHDLIIPKERIPSSGIKVPNIKPTEPPLNIQQISIKRLQSKQVQIDKSLFIGNHLRREAIYQDKTKLQAISLQVYELKKSPEQILAAIQKIEKRNIPGVTKVEGYGLNKHELTFYLQKQSQTLLRFMKSTNKKQQTLLTLSLALIQLARGVLQSGLTHITSLQPQMISLDSQDVSNPTISSLFLTDHVFTANPSYLSPDPTKTTNSLTFSLGVILLQLFFGTVPERGVDLEITKLPRRYNCQAELLKILGGMTYKEERRYTLEEAAEKFLKLQREASQVIHAPKTLAPVVNPRRTPVKEMKETATVQKNVFTLEGKKAQMSNYMTVAAKTVTVQYNHM